MAKEHLTEARKQQLEELCNNLHRHNFYTILVVEADADRPTIRKAYFALSKLCHPDNYVDKDMGRYLSYMEKIFQACSKAYDVLGNANKRQRYDAYLEKKKDTANYATNVLQQEADLSKALEAAAKKRAEASQVQDPQGPPPVQVPEQPPGPTSPSPPPADSKPVSSAPPAASPRARTHQDAETRKRHDSRRRSWTRDSAKRRLLGTVGTAPARMNEQKGRSWVTEARKAQEEGETLSAINALRMAIDVDPGNEEAKKLLEEVMSTASGELGQRYYEMARSELEFGEMNPAIVSIEKAVNLCPETPAYLALAANVLLKSDGDLHKAYDYAQRAAVKETRSASHQLLLGKILMKAGLQARARGALGKAVELDPKLKEARSLLSSL
ncbi:MAG: DnaJ domain-containing protein [Deltaproteobacteria bacterium]|nr:DnaJ domain-containing protein [Deltaproteobacteria bacterium]